MGPGEKDVTINIKVKDAQVDLAEAKMKRLKAAANDVGSGSGKSLSQQEKLAKFLGNDVPQAASKATAELQNAAAATSEAGGAAATAGTAMVGLGTILGAVAGAVVIAVLEMVAMVAVVVSIAQEVSHLSKEFADNALAVGKLADETGLAAETASALKVELEAQGRSVNDLNGGINEFRKTIGQAAAGSEDARAKLKQFGIDGQRAIYDVDGAFKQVIATIVRTSNPLDQARLGFAAFGSEWVKIQPIVRDFPGDIDAVIRKAEQLGLIISGKDVQAAKEFNRNYSDLNNALKGITNTFGREFLPMVTKVLRDLNGWLQSNKAEIKAWAEWSAGWVQTAIDRWTGFFNILAKIKGILPYISPAAGAISLSGGSTPAPQAGPKLYDYSRPEDLPQGAPDLAAMDAARAQQEKELKDAIERNKKDWDAAIKLWENSGNEAGTALTRIFSDLKDKLEKGGRIGDFIQGVNAATSGYLATTSQVYTQLEQLEDERARRNKATDTEMEVLEQEQLKRRQDWANKAYEIQKQASDLVTSTQKKATEQQLADYKAGLDRKDALAAGNTQKVLAQLKVEFDSGNLTEEAYLNRIDIEEKGLLDVRLQHAQDYLAKVKGNKEKEADAEQQVNLIKQQIAEADAKRDDEAILRKKKLLEQYNQLTQTLQDQLDEVERFGRPLSEYEKTLRDIERNYKDLDPAQKQNLLNIASEIDAVKALQAEYQKVKETIKNMLDYVIHGDFKGLGRSLLDSVRNSISDKISGVLATIVTGYDPNATNNPVAKPIVKEITGTNKRLDQVIKLLGGAPGTTGLGGGLGNILTGINGGSLGGLGGGGTTGGGSAGGAQGGSIIDRLRNLFSTGDGGIFAPRQNALSGHTSKLGGILGGVGDLATIVGGVVGGRVGGIISAVGTGLSIGAMFGPVGAVIGAGIGLIAGLFAGDPKKKQDKEQNIPALQKGFADSMTQLNKILDDLRHLNIDPDDAINQATAIRADIAGGFGIQFQSKKYRKQSQQMIASQLAQADSIISQIRSSAEIARGAADRSKRILPEFAAGTYFADYFKPNGLLPGMFDGRDNILAMISRGEMVLNPGQQRNIRALAGFDVFAGAGIPNYPNESSSSKLAIGGIAGAGLALASQPIVVQPNFSVTLVGVPIGQHIEGYITGDDGKRTLVKVVTKNTTAQPR